MPALCCAWWESYDGFGEQGDLFFGPVVLDLLLLLLLYFLSLKLLFLSFFSLSLIEGLPGLLKFSDRVFSRQFLDNVNDLINLFNSVVLLANRFDPEAIVTRAFQTLSTQLNQGFDLSLVGNLLLLLGLFFDQLLF